MARTPLPQSWHPATYDLADVNAVRAVATGAANEEQQRRAMRWVIERAARTYEPSYTGGPEAETVHAEGRRAVGREIVKLINMPAVVLAKMRDNDVGNHSETG